MKASIYDTITQQIVDAIEAGTPAYRMPWHASGQSTGTPVNAVTSRSYRGLNILSLWAVAEARGYSSGNWATYQQWTERGAQIRKGEKAAPVVFWKQLGKRGDEEGEQQRGGMVAKGYNVFNADQVEGYTPAVEPVLSEDERLAYAEAFFARIPARITHGGNVPCFVPSFDEVRMVPFSQFTTAEGYYSVLSHELTHWSGGEKRLNRDLSGRFGSDSYAMEELVAELGAAFLTGHLGLGNEPRQDHAPYIASWLRVLKGDARAIFTASAKAQAAVDYLCGFQEMPT